MGKALKKFPSKSSPGKLYTVYESNDGTNIYCDCWVWKRNKTCGHVLQFLEGSVDERALGKFQLQTETTQTATELDEIINRFFCKL
jgi:hypothetical protein